MFAGFKKGLSAAAQATGAAVSKAVEATKEFAEDWGQPKVLKDYKLGPAVAATGPQACWKIYSGTPRNPSAQCPAMQRGWPAPLPPPLHNACRGCVMPGPACRVATHCLPC